ncbi:hypothetical protein D3C71_1904230 [compost metagenome]
MELAAHRERGQQLPGERAEHRHGRRHARIHAPRPERHRDHAEREPGQALDETGNGGAEGNEDDDRIDGHEGAEGA